MCQQWTHSYNICKVQVFYYIPLLCVGVEDVFELYGHICFHNILVRNHNSLNESEKIVNIIIITQVKIKHRPTTRFFSTYEIPVLDGSETCNLFKYYFQNFFKNRLPCKVTRIFNHEMVIIGAENQH